MQEETEVLGENLRGQVLIDFDRVWSFRSFTEGGYILKCQINLSTWNSHSPCERAMVEMFKSSRAGVWSSNGVAHYGLRQ